VTFGSDRLESSKIECGAIGEIDPQLVMTCLFEHLI